MANNKEVIKRINNWLHLHYRVGDYIVEDEWPTVVYQITKIWDAHCDGLFSPRYCGAVIETKNLGSGHTYDVKLDFYELETAAGWNNPFCRYRVISKAEALERLTNKLDYERGQASLKNMSMEEIASRRRSAIEEEGRSVSDSALDNIIASLRRMK